MTEEAGQPPFAAPKIDPARLELRARPRPAVRFRKGLIVTLAGLAAGLVAAVSWIALDAPKLRVDPPPEGTAFAAKPSDVLEDLPEDYEGVPILGPPLPGDLGRPILKHRLGQRDLPGDEADPKAAEEEKAASIKSYPLLVELGRPAANHAVGVEPPAQQSGLVPVAVNEARSHLPVLSAGTIIAASLISGINSDVPGLVLAQVTQPVRDSATGEEVLIPQGARLVGEYDSKTSYGQERAILTWNRIVLPDGRSIALDNLPAADRAGYSGLADEVDFHGWRLLKGVALSTVLGIGNELALGDEDSALARALGDSGGLAGSRAGDEITRRNLDVKPTITVRPGWPLRLILHEDMAIEAWKG